MRTVENLSALSDVVWGELNIVHLEFRTLNTLKLRGEQWWHKKPKNSENKKKANGHTRGEVVLIILRKK